MVWRSVALGAIIALTVAAQDTSPVSDWIKANAVRLDTVEAGHGFTDMQPLKQMVGDARIVALGEATHGTREFFQLKHRMLEFLASEMGFTIFGIEANMPEAYRLNEYVLHGTGEPVSLIKGMYFWTWDTEEVLAMVKWMREFNAGGKGRVQFTGFDMQTPDVASKIARDFLQAKDAEYASAQQKAFAMALAPTVQQGAFASATGSFPAAAAAGKTVRFSGYIKTEGVATGYAGLWWRADANGHPLVFRNLGDGAPKGTGDWKKFELEVAVPAETQNINFGALLAGEGKAWFDGLAVDVDGVRYENESVFRFLQPNRYQQGPYELLVDRDTVREGRPALEIRRMGQPIDAVNPKEAAEVWRGLVAHMEQSRGKYGAGPETEWAIQNARVVVQCMEMRANEVTRDASMAANIQWILDQNPGARMVVWAHNGHVNFVRTAGFVPMGAALREIYGSRMVVFGFGFNQGSFRAVEQGKSLRPFTVAPAPAGSLDAAMAAAGIPLFALDLRQIPKSGQVAEWFAQPHAARSVGASYSESAAANYFQPAIAPKTFDALLFVEKTTAARGNPPAPAAPPEPPKPEYRDGQYGVSMKLTPQVQVQSVYRWGDQETTVQLTLPKGTAALYFRILREPRAITEEAARKTLSSYMQSKANDRVRQGSEGYRIRQESCRQWAVADRPAMSCVADFQYDGQDMSEYLTYVISEKTTALFFGRIDRNQMDDFRAGLDKVIETVKLP